MSAGACPRASNGAQIREPWRFIAEVDLIGLILARLDVERSRARVATPTFTIFVRGLSGEITLNPADNWVFVTFLDSQGLIRSSTWPQRASLVGVLLRWP